MWKELSLSADGEIQKVSQGHPEEPEVYILLVNNSSLCGAVGKAFAKHILIGLISALLQVPVMMTC